MEEDDYYSSDTKVFPGCFSSYFPKNPLLQLLNKSYPKRDKSFFC